MENMMDAACELENIRSQLEYVAGVSKVCAVAYEQSGSYGSISEEETANAFYSIHAQIKKVTDEVNTLIPIVLQDVTEKMHEKEPQSD